MNQEWWYRYVSLRKLLPYLVRLRISRSCTDRGRGARGFESRKDITIQSTAYIRIYQ